MQVFEMVFLLLVILALIGVVIYFVYYYINEQEITNNNIASTIDMVNAEKSDRLSNIKYVVDEVNTVNKDIYTTLSTSNLSFQSSISRNKDGIALLNTNLASMSTALGPSGFGALIQFSSNTQKISMTDLPGAKPGGVDIKLLGNVVATMGMTANGLAPNKSFQLCGDSSVQGANAAGCIKFPDADGNTYMTTLVANKSIVLDAPTTVKNNLTVSGVISGQITSSNMLVCGTAASGATAPCASISARQGENSPQLVFGNEIVYQGKRVTTDSTGSNLILV